MCLGGGGGKQEADPNAVSVAEEQAKQKAAAEEA